MRSILLIPRQSQPQRLTSGAAHSTAHSRTAVADKWASRVSGPRANARVRFNVRGCGPLDLDPTVHIHGEIGVVRTAQFIRAVDFQSNGPERI